MKEIVAAKIGDIITSHPRLIAAAMEMGQDVEMLERRHMQLMAALDLGPRWQALADSPTLFCIDEDGVPQPAPGMPMPPHSAGGSR